MAATSEAEQLAAEAAITVTKPAKPPVIISGEAHKHYANMLRLWTGWDKASLVFDDPMPVSPWAMTDHDTKTVTVNPDELILNPNRLLLTMTPFRMKQEAVLTGTLLHEAGHARHSLWIPRNAKQAAKFVHKDKSPINKQTLAFARMMEEPRVEGMMARDANKIGAIGLGWTMRAAAAHLIPMTTLSMDPNQRVMDVIASWSSRAGRHLATNHWITSHGLNNWVNDLTALCEQTVQAHLYSVEDSQPMVTSQRIMTLLMEMLWCSDDKGKTMIETSKTILELLYPDQDGDSDGAPQPGAGCAGGKTEQSDEDGDESPEQDEGGGEGQAPPDSQSEDDPDPMQEALTKAIAEALSKMEDEAEQDSGEEKTESEGQADDTEGTPSGEAGGREGGQGQADVIKGQFRLPTAEERNTQKAAERFLRSMIDPSTASKVILTESPSATVDGAALSAWKAGGQINDPHFFKRTKRVEEPTPPIRIAILVDVSSSMEDLQKPSAVLSWALASACLDLRNFAGRGSQIESTLIHWGDVAQVIQKPGQLIPGIREVRCNQGTSAMDEAFDLIEEQIPDFFDLPEDGKPSNRLIVQFTDWQLFGGCANRMGPKMARAMEAGVNMVTVYPDTYSARSSSLDRIMAAAPIQRGRSTVMTYNRKAPNEVWETASKALS